MSCIVPPSLALVTAIKPIRHCISVTVAGSRCLFCIAAISVLTVVSQLNLGQLVCSSEMNPVTGLLQTAPLF